jgi:hypothetical protein
MTTLFDARLYWALLAVAEGLCVWLIAWDRSRCRRDHKAPFDAPKRTLPEVTPDDKLARSHEAAVAEGELLVEELRGGQP